MGAIAASAGGISFFTPWTPTPALPVVIALYGGISLCSVAWIWLGYTAVRRPTLAKPARA